MLATSQTKLIGQFNQSSNVFQILGLNREDMHLEVSAAAGDLISVGAVSFAAASVALQRLYWKEILPRDSQLHEKETKPGPPTVLFFTVSSNVYSTIH